MCNINFSTVTRQELVNTMNRAQQISRVNDNSIFEMYLENVEGILEQASKSASFGGKIAAEIMKRNEEYSKAARKIYAMPRISPKQAWCIAYAIIPE